MKRAHILFFIGFLMLGFSACRGSAASLDAQLQEVITAKGVTALDIGDAPDAAKVALGQMLFFDKELSGNRDISCATCHHPTQASGDGLSVSIGTGGMGLGPERQIGYGRSFIPRNAPEVFNRGAAEWTTMFWDSRVTVQEGAFMTPAGTKLLPGLDNVLAAQAMFPVTSGDEMRGAEGDMDVNGHANELSMLDGDDLHAIWAGLMDRLLTYPGYVDLFQAAYPDVPLEELTFAHAANAIAAFEIQAYSLPSSPWTNYLNGENDALTDQQKEGALLFYGDAGCANCHNGSLLTDQTHHALAVPQVGPGKGDESPLDLGRWRETHDDAEMYAFRTPSLHNVAVSGPYMHDGAFATLEAAVLHHLDPETSLYNYDPAAHVPAELVETFQDDPNLLADMLDYVDPLLAPERELKDSEVEALLAFLEALTDPAVRELDQYVPATVPSGLPVQDLAAQSSN